MKNLIRCSLAAATLSLAFSLASHAAESEPGYVDVGQLMASAKGKFVEVNLSTGMLKFAAKLAARQEPEAAELIGNLKRIRVNVVSLDDSNRKDAVAQIDSIRQKLESQGWTQMVSVREQEGGDNVDIHVKQHGDDVIEGLVVTVIDHKGEAVVVNIVGSLNADQIAKVAEHLNIEPLKQLRVKIKHDRPKTKDDEA
jgi:Skp family chaperone for outer membrane proteins